MMLNILITFAQYEREIIAERIRDKIASSKQKGMNTGGIPPMGYESDPTTKKYHIVPEEAEVVQRIFETYLKLGSARDTATELDKAGVYKRIRVSKRSGIQHGGGRLTGAYIYGILKNPVYAGYVKHYDKLFSGEHEAIISKEVWENTQKLLKENSPYEGSLSSARRIMPFQRIVRCGYCGCAMKASYTQKSKNRTYYYLTIIKLAEEENIDRSMLNKIMSLVNLAPDIVEGIMDDPPTFDFSVKKIFSHQLPSDWNEQRKFLGLPVKDYVGKQKFYMQCCSILSNSSLMKSIINKAVSILFGWV